MTAIPGLSGTPGKCSKCGEPIYRVHTVDGQAIYLNPDLSEDGTHVISVRTGGKEIAVPETDEERTNRLNREHERATWVVHAATCGRNPKRTEEPMAAKKAGKRTGRAKTGADHLEDRKAGKTTKDFMQEKADEDRADFRARTLEDALEQAKLRVDTLRKAIAYGLANTSDEVRADMLRDVGDMAGELRERARAAIRAVATENRNVQT